MAVYLQQEQPKSSDLLDATGITRTLAITIVSFVCMSTNSLVESSAVFGGREEVGVVHRDANPFRIFAILWNAGNGKFDGDRLATMVKHIGICEKG
ncbi:hypothetical protein TNCV_3155601 [Trichonephila clavipes]|nr:hypothetical protein TNCV_3155601 [Trichonephila clavipes]